MIFGRFKNSLNWKMTGVYRYKAKCIDTKCISGLEYRYFEGCIDTMNNCIDTMNKCIDTFSHVSIQMDKCIDTFSIVSIQSIMYRYILNRMISSSYCQALYRYTAYLYRYKLGF